MVRTCSGELASFAAVPDMRNDIKTLSARYQRAMETIPDIEGSYRNQLADLAAARADRRAADITVCRLNAQQAEERLVEALGVADKAHQAYWQARRAALLPSVQEAARLILEFDRIAKAARDPSAYPAMAVIQTIHACPPLIDVAEDIPIEGPDSELLSEERGGWR